MAGLAELPRDLVTLEEWDRLSWTRRVAGNSSRGASS